jgi:hypothetical protein
MNPKKQAMYAHKIAALFTILADDLSEFLPDSPIAIQIKEKAEEILPLAENLLNEVYGVDEVRMGTYLNDLANKLDTVIRKNFEQMT